MASFIVVQVHLASLHLENLAAEPLQGLVEGLRNYLPNTALLHDLAIQNNLRHHLVSQKDDLAERIPTPLSFAASDVLITASFGFLLPEALLDIVPPRHAINIHPSLLPKYRGAAPIQWAIANGETQSGVTVQTLSRGKFDQGLVLDQRAVDLPSKATFFDALPTFAEKGLESLITVLDHFEERKDRAKPQEGKATSANKVSKDRLRCDWLAMSALELERMHRAWNHHSPLWTTIHGKRVQLLEVEELESESTHHLREGEFIMDRFHGCLRVGCARETAVAIRRLKLDGSKEKSAMDFWNGISNKRHSVYFDS